MGGRFDTLGVAEIDALAKLLMPAIANAAKSSVVEAIRSTPTPMLRAGTVETVELLTSNIPGRVYVTLDGDSTPTPCACAYVHPREGSRVVVQFAPPAGAYVVGHIDSPATADMWCTSSTRPLNPLRGMTIYETDKVRRWLYDGSIWRFIGGVAPTCRVHRASAQSIANTTIVAIQFDAEDYDDDGCHDNATNNTRITFPYAGVWFGEFDAGFAANATGLRSAWMNCSNTAANPGSRRANPDVLSTPGGFDCVLSSSGTIRVPQSGAGTDYIELDLVQGSGGNLNVMTSTAHYLQVTLLPIWY